MYSIKEELHSASRLNRILGLWNMKSQVQEAVQQLSLSNPGIRYGVYHNDIRFGAYCNGRKI